MSGPDVLDTAAASGVQVLWRPDPTGEWPLEAAWDDGLRRYHMFVLDAAPGDWSHDDLMAFVAALD